MTKTGGPAKESGLPALLAYAAGSVGTGIYSTVPGILLLYYMTQALGLPVILASLVILIPKAAIILLDPLIGSWSDGLKSRHGRRRPFLLAGGLTSGATFVALFSLPPLASDTATAAVIGALYFLASASYSLFAVPYVAMPAEMTASAERRSVIISLRIGFVFAGILAGAALAPVLVEAFGGGRSAYSQMAICLAALSTAAMLVTVFGAPNQSADPVHSPAPALRTGLRVFGFLPWTLALTAYALAMTAAGTASAAAPYFVVLALGRPEGDVALVFACQILVCIAGMLVWPHLVNRAGAARTLAFGCVLSAAGALAFSTVVEGSGTAHLGLVSAFNGIGLGGVQVAGFALLAQVTRQLNLHMSGRHEGLVTGLWTASEKLALAAGPALCALTLSSGGFEAQTGRDSLPPSALGAAATAFTLVPAAILLIPVILILTFGRLLSERDTPRLRALTEEE